MPQRIATLFASLLSALLRLSAISVGPYGAPALSYLCHRRPLGWLALPVTPGAGLAELWAEMVFLWERSPGQLLLVVALALAFGTLTIRGGALLLFGEDGLFDLGAVAQLLLGVLGLWWLRELLYALVARPWPLFVYEEHY
jgi:hypothetical protein